MEFVVVPAPNIIVPPKVQQALQNPEAWNAQWEKLLLLITPESFFEKYLKYKKAKGKAFAESTDIYRHHLLCCLSLRRDYGVALLNALIGHNFEALWNDSSVAVRRKHVLIGLSEVCSVAINLNEARCYAKDILILDHLANEGRVFIDLIKLIIPRDDREAKQFLDLPGRTWEEFVRSEESKRFDKARKTILGEIKALRGKLIYCVVYYTMLSFFDQPRPIMTVQKTRVDMDWEKKMTKEGEAELAKIYGKAAAKKMTQENIASFLECKSLRKATCENCYKVESDQAKYQRCAKCWDTLQREVYYCSRACQSAAYKGRHKGMCGKALDMDSAAKHAVSSIPASSSPSQIPPATGSFKRSLTLVKHIRLLDSMEDPNAEYIVYLRRGNTALNMDAHYGALCDLADSPPIQTLFRAARDKAMTTGDRDSIMVLCHYVLWHFSNCAGCDIEAMFDAMVREWEIPKLDMKMKILTLEERQYEDSHKRPPLVQNVDPAVWESYVTRKPQVAANFSASSRSLKSLL